MPSLTQLLLIVRQSFSEYPAPKLEDQDGEQNEIPIIPEETVSCYTTQTHLRGVKWDSTKSPEGGGRNATFHYLPAALGLVRS